MLSFLYRLMRSFRREHGYAPNVVTMSAAHFRILRENLADMRDSAEISRLLGMEVILGEECTPPHVGWMPMARRATG